MKYKMKSSKAEKLFRNTAKSTHIKNVSDRPMRGGIRL